jgi:hypothetical protein
MFVLSLLVAICGPIKSEPLEFAAIRTLAAFSGAEITTSGSAVGIEYSVTSAGLQNTEFEISQESFKFSSPAGLGKPAIQLSINKGVLVINGKQAGGINSGDRLTVSSDREVKINSRAIR